MPTVCYLVPLIPPATLRHLARALSLNLSRWRGHTYLLRFVLLLDLDRAIMTLAMVVSPTMVPRAGEFMAAKFAVMQLGLKQFHRNKQKMV